MKKSKFDASALLLVLLIALLGLAISFLCFSTMLFHQINLGLFTVFGIYCALQNKKIANNENKKVMMLNFIDQFIISLSIHKTLLASVKSVEELSEIAIKRELASFSDGEPWEKIDYLSQYFNHNIYEAFLDIIKTYLEQGGEILKSSSALLKEVGEERANMIKIKQLHSQKLAELIIGWAFVFLIIGMLRFVVSAIYQSLLLNNTFVYGLEFFIIFILVSFVFYFKIVFSTQVEPIKKITTKNKYIPVTEFVKTFALFRMNLGGSGNIYKTLEKTANYSQGLMAQELLQLVGELKTNTNLTPFIKFASRFKEPLVKHILINIYQMMINGGDPSTLFEFNYLFDRLYELNAETIFTGIKRKYENLAQMPMMGSGILVMLIMVGVVGLLGNMLYV